MPVLGICNGFQMLVEAQLLPGGLIRNDHGTFICRDQVLRGRERVDRVDRAEFDDRPGDHDPAEERRGRLHRLRRRRSTASRARAAWSFRYVDVNPNGSLRDIAGITNERGNVVGLMPHPEHAVEPGFGPDTAAAMRSGVDGLGVLHEHRHARPRRGVSRPRPDRAA